MNSDFTILDSLRKLVDMPCRRIKVKHRYGNKSNSNTMKHQTSYKKVVMPLPELELLRPPSSRDQINKLDKSENLNQKLSCSTENTKHLLRPIPIGQLDRNIMRLKKRHSSKQYFSPNISLPCPDPPVERHSISLSHWILTSRICTWM